MWNLNSKGKKKYITRRLCIEASSKTLCLIISFCVCSSSTSSSISMCLGTSRTRTLKYYLRFVSNRFGFGFRFRGHRFLGFHLLDNNKKREEKGKFLNSQSHLIDSWIRNCKIDFQNLIKLLAFAIHLPPMAMVLRWLSSLVPSLWVFASEKLSVPITKYKYQNREIEVGIESNSKKLCCCCCAHHAAILEFLQPEQTINLDLEVLLNLTSLFHLLHFRVHHRLSLLQRFLCSLLVRSQPLQLLLDCAQLLRQRRLQRRSRGGGGDRIRTDVLLVGVADSWDLETWLIGLGLGLWGGVDGIGGGVFGLKWRPARSWPQFRLSGRRSLHLRLHLVLCCVVFGWFVNCFEFTVWLGAESLTVVNKRGGDEEWVLNLKPDRR